MSLLSKLPALLEESRITYKAILAEKTNDSFSVSERIGVSKTEEPLQQNLMALGDNAAFMRYLIKEKKMGGTLSLIYIDPPFYSKSDYGAEIRLNASKDGKIPVIKQKAYHDTWENGMEEYLRMLLPRLFLMKDLLSETGSIFVHLDWHASHYVKILMDEIFGEKNFINEIVWQYKSGGVSKRYFARKHDTLLFYAKTKKYFFSPQQEKSYNRDYKPYRFKGVKEYRDELGWYTMVNRKDVWSIDMVGRTASERTGYVTQKPEALLARMLESCTEPGDICADFFGGSGTLAATAQKMGRRWITCDLGRFASISMHKRLSAEGGGYDYLEQHSLRDASEANGTLKAEITFQDCGFTNQKLLQVRLTGYEPKTLGNLPIAAKYHTLIQNLLKKDSLQFLDYWSIDCASEGTVHQPEAHFSKQNDCIETLYEALKTDCQRVTIKAFDLFGNSATLQRNLSEEK